VYLVGKIVASPSIGRRRTAGRWTAPRHETVEHFAASPRQTGDRDLPPIDELTPRFFQ
jgi:hypothetical protein